MSSGQQESQPKQIPRTPPAYQNWWTLKVLVPNKTAADALKTDEWCATFCTQSVAGRSRGFNPSCRTFCVRKVFANEVRNVLSYPRHTNIGSDGKAKYPLPPEGQFENLPRILRGYHPKDSEKEPETRYWDEGWYFWTNNTFEGSVEKLSGMSNFRSLARRAQSKQEAAAIWKEYQQYLERRRRIDFDPDAPIPEQDRKWHSKMIPPRPLPDTSPSSLLVPMPPDFAVFRRIGKLLEPSHQVLSIVAETYSSGDFREFSRRMSEKAWTKEPFLLAKNACKKFIDTLREVEAGDDDSDKKTPR